MVRKQEVLAFEVQCMQYYLGDTYIEEAQMRSKQRFTSGMLSSSWCLRAAQTCRILWQSFSERSDRVVQNFHRWAETDLREIQQPGVAFDDCYVRSKEWKTTHIMKDAQHSCYISVPVP